MLYLNKYKLNNSMIFNNFIKTERIVYYNKIINRKNCNNIIFNHNFYNLFMRSFIFYFFFMYFFNSFNVFTIKNRPSNFVNLNITAFNFLDINCLSRFSRSDF